MTREADEQDFKSTSQAHHNYTSTQPVKPKGTVCKPDQLLNIHLETLDRFQKNMKGPNRDHGRRPRQEKSRKKNGNDFDSDYSNRLDHTEPTAIVKRQKKQLQFNTKLLENKHVIRPPMRAFRPQLISRKYCLIH